jgi:chromosome segregation ATPase
MADTERLAAQLEGILSGDSVVGAFSEFRGVRDHALLVANRCSRIRTSLVKELDRFQVPAGEAAQVRQERRALDEQVGRLPTDEEGMSSAYESQREAIDQISHVLTETTHTVELVHSMASALDQYLSSPENWGNLTEAEVQAMQSEIRLVTGAVASYRERSQAMRQQVDVIRAQVQVGQVTAETAQVIRDRHRQLVAQEVAYLSASDATVSRVNGALGELTRVEGDLGIVLQTLEGHAQERSRDLLAAVNEERAKLQGYRDRLGLVENDAAEVVGGYAFENFETIAGRFEDLILRADVGVADSAWSLAEEHRRRMIQMGQQRDRDLEAIQLEYDDLLGN